MDTSRAVVIHFNPTLTNQILYKDYLLAGFGKLGMPAYSTDDQNADGAIHVCIGPHYAFRQCLGKSTIYIDRCLWGDDLKYVTIGWLDDNGGMIYPVECDNKRTKPRLERWVKPGRSALFLFDYGPYPELYKECGKHYFMGCRPHPATNKRQPPLLDHLRKYSLAIGYRTSALVTAVINGYPTISLDSRCPAYPVSGHDILDIVRPDRRQWLNNMSYAQWSGKEIASGEALRYVLAHQANPGAHLARGGETSSSR